MGRGKSIDPRGYIELIERKRKPPIWVFNHFRYTRQNKRIHLATRLGPLDRMTREQAEARAEEIRTKVRDSQPSLRRYLRRYLVSRTNEAKAICSDQEYMGRLEAQNHRCKICNDKPKRLCVDHDHDTGEVRGLLCGRCNSGIGLLGDDPAILRASADYLENFARSCTFHYPRRMAVIPLQHIDNIEEAGGGS